MSTIEPWEPAILTKNFEHFQDSAFPSEHSMLVAAQAICERLDRVIALLEEQDASKED